MPIYEYLCRCGEVTPYISNKLNGGPLTVRCQSCGKRAKKILSTVIHKGKVKGEA